MRKEVNEMKLSLSPRQHRPAPRASLLLPVCADLFNRRTTALQWWKKTDFVFSQSFRKNFTSTQPSIFSGMKNE